MATIRHAEDEGQRPDGKKLWYLFLKITIDAFNSSGKYPGKIPGNMPSLINISHKVILKYKRGYLSGEPNWHSI